MQLTSPSLRAPASSGPRGQRGLPTSVVVTPIRRSRSVFTSAAMFLASSACSSAIEPVLSITNSTSMGVASPIGRARRRRASPVVALVVGSSPESSGSPEGPYVGPLRSRTGADRQLVEDAALAAAAGHAPARGAHVTVVRTPATVPSFARSRRRAISRALSSSSIPGQRLDRRSCDALAIIGVAPASASGTAWRRPPCGRDGSGATDRRRRGPATSGPTSAHRARAAHRLVGVEEARSPRSRPPRAGPGPASSRSAASRSCPSRRARRGRAAPSPEHGSCGSALRNSWITAEYSALYFSIVPCVFMSLPPNMSTSRSGSRRWIWRCRCSASKLSRRRVSAPIWLISS